MEKFTQARKGILCGGALAMAMGLSAQERQPNIIMFLVDDMGWQDTEVPFYKDSTNLNRRYHTPNMTRLAQMGVKFTEAYACAISSPSRASLMSGMNAARHRVTNWTLEYDTQTDAASSVLQLPSWSFNGIQPDTVRSAHNTKNSTLVTPLPQILRENGYYTIHCGKAHYGARTTASEDPLTMGYDVNIAGGCNGAPGSFLASKHYGEGTAQAVVGLEKYWGTDTFLSEALTLEAIEAMKKPIAEGKPFYLYMSHYAIHVPYDKDDRFASLYQGVYDEQLKAVLNQSEVNRATLVTGMDKSLGDLLDFLEEAGEDVAQNTIVLFMSDNGGQGLTNVRQGRNNRDQNYPQRAGKGSAFMGGVHEPMMVYWPGVTEGGTVNTSRVMIEDFFPTILEMAGVKDYETHQVVDGRSFVDVLKDPTINRDRPIVWHFPNLWGESQDKEEGYGAYSSILKGDYHLIYTHETQQRRLFNIREDVGEEHDLALEMPDLVQELSEELTATLKDCNAQMPTYKATGEPVPWPADLGRPAGAGDTINVVSNAPFQLSTDAQKYYYRVSNRQAENESAQRTGYWMVGEHYGYPAVQMTVTRYATGERQQNQLFYFLPGSDDQHFRIMTYDDQNVNYVEGKTAASWGDGNPDEQETTVTDKYLQYGTSEAGEFVLLQGTDEDFFAIAVGDELLNDLGSDHGGQANMKWVIGGIDGTLDNLKANYGSQYSFELYDPNGNVAVGNVATPHNGIFRYSTDTEKYYYTIGDSRSFLWTQGEHYGFPAIQCTNEKWEGDEAQKQLYYFMPGRSNQNFYIYTYDGQPLTWAPGTTVDSWNGGNILDQPNASTHNYVQYDSEGTPALFQLVKSATTGYYGLRAAGTLLNDRGSGNGAAANMLWVVNGYNGNSVNDAGSLYTFTPVQVEGGEVGIGQVQDEVVPVLSKAELIALGQKALIYNLRGERVADLKSAERGIYIVKLGDLTYKVSIMQ